MRACAGAARPFLGICVGMQLMAERGREYQIVAGLGWIAGEVDRISPGDRSLKIPHMGWNTLDAASSASAARRIPAGPQGPTLTSFILSTSRPDKRADLVAETDYGGPITAIVARDRWSGPSSTRRRASGWAEADREFSRLEAVNGWQGVVVILFPAIDLKDGGCVRLEQGDMARATVFHHDPAEQAQSFEMQGFEYLHIVDLDGAFAGKPVNASAVERILETVAVPIQLGGGIRDMRHHRSLVRARACNRVIIGTAAVRDPALVRYAARRFPDRVAVGLDARDGKAAVEGWAETLRARRTRLARQFEDAGVAAIIYTDIARDGLLRGLNLEAAIALAEAVDIPVIAAGGLGSIEDVRLCSRRERKARRRRCRTRSL